MVATARRPEQLADLQATYGRNIRPFALDVTHEAQAKKAFQAAISSFGSLDVLVNNAGFGNASPVEDTSLADFRSQIRRIFFGVIMMIESCAPLLP